MDSRGEKILSTVAAADYIGRESELEAVLRHARGVGGAAALHLAAAPGLGVSELLRQAYDRLFLAADEAAPAPFYFAFKAVDRTAAACARRFLREFLWQTIAYRRRHHALLDFGGDFDELTQLALASDLPWIDRLIEAVRDEKRFTDERLLVRTALGAPLRAAALGLPVFVMLDDLHEAAELEGGLDLVAELTDVFARAETPFVFASRRRFRFDKERRRFATLDLRPLSFAASGALALALGRSLGVRINEQTRDLLAVQFDGSPFLLKSIVESAADKRMDLESFGAVQKVYADEIFGGRIAQYYDRLFARVAPQTETQKQFLGLLYDALTVAKGKNQTENWQARSDLAETDFRRALRRLHLHEFVRASSSLVEAMSENQALADYLEARFRLEMTGANRALTVGETLAEFFKRAPRTMAAYYRRRAAIGLRELLGAFDRQSVPRALLDYGVFRGEHKGAPHAEVLRALGGEAERIALPQIVYTAHTVAFYAPFSELLERERSAVALGFQESSYTDEDETVWIAAEIDAKLEASKDLAELWCDRLEMVALMCNFLNYKIWLVAPEGFAPEALELLARRHAFGSSRRQVELLTEYLGAQDALRRGADANEYEMIVPMGDDTEMIAAQTVEEIARRHHFAPKAINQIKTALVEACINATEHSLSPDRKIYQKFAVEDDRLVITIANRGLRLADKKAREVVPDESRRGWGLKLMKTLMDEVKFEQTDDGTRISMTKYLTK